MEDVLPALEHLDYVTRYARFSARPKNSALGWATLFDQSNSLTSLGHHYASFQSIKQ